MHPTWKSLRTYGLAAMPGIVAIVAPVLGILGMLGRIEPMSALALILLLQCLCWSLSSLRPFQDLDRHDRASYSMSVTGMAASCSSLGLLGALQLDWLQPIAAVIMIICCGCSYVVLNRTLRNAKTQAAGPSGA